MKSLNSMADPEPGQGVLVVRPPKKLRPYCLLKSSTSESHLTGGLLYCSYNFRKSTMSNQKLKRMLWGTLWAALLALTSPAQHFPSISGRQQDLNFVSTQLPALHPNFFHQSNRPTFNQAVAELTAKISNATDSEFYTGLVKLVAMAGDGHTSIATSSAPFQFFPLQLRWFPDGVFVTGASDAYSQALGTQLIRVGNTPIADAMRQLAGVIPHENDAWLLDVIGNSLINQTLLQGLGLLPASGASPLAFRKPGGDEFTLQLDTALAPLANAIREDQGPIPLYQQSADLNYWYTYSAENRMLYFRYNSCANIPGNPFATFVTSLFATLDNNPVDTFVFDIRSNSGGDSGIVAPLFNGLASRFSTLSANPQFRIYDVFNGGTFSSGLMNAEDLLIPYPESIPGPNRNVNLSTRVTSIGQPSGGKPSHYGNPTGFLLPGSNIRGKVSTRLFPLPSGFTDTPSLYPSITVELRSTDYFARFDPVMAAILGRGAGPPPLPTGGLITVNAAGFRTGQGIAPGSFAAAFGHFPAVPDEVLVNGAAATIASAGTSQVNFTVPDSAPFGRATVEARVKNKEIATGSVTLSRTGPGIFVSQLSDLSQPGAILNQDGALNSKTHPAKAGSIVQVFGTGYGGQPVQVYFAERPVAVAFSGPAAQFPGLWQVNVTVPAGLNGQVPLFFFSDSFASNGVTLWVS